MANDIVTLTVPSGIAERFLPEEAPTFEVIRSVGRCQLWKSQTVPHRLGDGVMRLGRVRYHITVNDEAELVLMPSLVDHALPNFEYIVNKETHHG